MGKAFPSRRQKGAVYWTSCQIAAVYSYLGKDRDHPNLYTMDVLCHGTASKKTVSSYIKDKEREYKKEIIDFKFRTKRNGWKDGESFRMLLSFADGSAVLQDKFADAFFYGFNHNLFLRESCYRCKYCGQERIADVTAGDFWGVSEEKVGSDAMKLGVSVVTFNTEKAARLMPVLTNKLELSAIDPNEAIPYNNAFTKPNSRPDYRDTFFKIMESSGFDKNVSKDAPYFFFKQKVKKILMKFIPEKILRQILAKLRHNT